MHADFSPALNETVRLPLVESAAAQDTAVLRFTAFLRDHEYQQVLDGVSKLQLWSDVVTSGSDHHRPNEPNGPWNAFDFKPQRTREDGRDHRISERMGVIPTPMQTQLDGEIESEAGHDVVTTGPRPWNEPSKSTSTSLELSRELVVLIPVAVRAVKSFSFTYRVVYPGSGETQWLGSYGEDGRVVIVRQFGGDLNRRERFGIWESIAGVKHSGGGRAFGDGVYNEEEDGGRPESLGCVRVLVDAPQPPATPARVASVCAGAVDEYRFLGLSSDPCRVATDVSNGDSAQLVLAVARSRMGVHASKPSYIIQASAGVSVGLNLSSNSLLGTGTGSITIYALYDLANLAPLLLSPPFQSPNHSPNAQLALQIDVLPTLPSRELTDADEVLEHAADVHQHPQLDTHDQMTIISTQTPKNSIAQLLLVPSVAGTNKPRIYNKPRNREDGAGFPGSDSSTGTFFQYQYDSTSITTPSSAGRKLGVDVLARYLKREHAISDPGEEEHGQGGFEQQVQVGAGNKLAVLFVGAGSDGDDDDHDDGKARGGDGKPHLWFFEPPFEGQLVEVDVPWCGAEVLVSVGYDLGWPIARESRVPTSADPREEGKRDEVDDEYTIAVFHPHVVLSRVGRKAREGLARTALPTPPPSPQITPFRRQVSFATDDVVIPRTYTNISESTPANNGTTRSSPTTTARNGSDSNTTRKRRSAASSREQSAPLSTQSVSTNQNQLRERSITVRERLRFWLTFCFHFLSIVLKAIFGTRFKRFWLGSFGGGGYARFPPRLVGSSVRPEDEEASGSERGAESEPEGGGDDLVVDSSEPVEGPLCEPIQSDVVQDAELSQDVDQPLSLESTSAEPFYAELTPPTAPLVTGKSGNTTTIAIGMKRLNKLDGTSPSELDAPKLAITVNGNVPDDFTLTKIPTSASSDQTWSYYLARFSLPPGSNGSDDRHLVKVER